MPEKSRTVPSKNDFRVVRLILSPLNFQYPATMPRFPLWLLPLTIPILYLLKSRTLPSRETVIPPDEERVLLLGASSGIGKDLALAYARRGAKIFLLARRADVLEEVRKECEEAAAQAGKKAEVLVFRGDMTKVADLVSAREMIVKGKYVFGSSHFL